ncbi:polyadenylate-binding protein, cytoplasmic and nuclear [Rhizophagus clarus]|uniref:Polyadenylate-binding protein, cytoplasmic and nuclear n=1 Tax=Rhizophagus clarus TaxID=94130 RepID=A0A8H3LNE8_9GLOM|nr:polyadenylate-binding protein, cytoplasmic and nuclear [Rhizophagus clarus]
MENTVNTPIATFNKKSKMQNTDSILSEPCLYAIELPYNNEDELRNIFKEVDNINVEFRPNVNVNTSVLRFSSIENAEKAFAIYNNIKLETTSRYLKLLINDPTKTMGNEPVSTATILQVKALPQNTTNIALYTLFRPFGPLFSCRIQFQQDNKFKGNALVQFFRHEDADAATKAMHCFQYEGRNITVTQYQGKNTKIRTNNNHISGSHNSYNLPTPAHTFQPQGSNNNNHNNNNNQPPMSPGPEGPLVDPCNLFIKNLDANISSSDLFNHFRRFGRIISARVMRDQDTGNSKGFGFVSYTSAEEADKAKNSMHGKTLGTKQIVVRLHEPKKLREAKLANQFNGNPSSPSESRTPSRRNSDFFNINTVNEFGQEDLNGLAPKARREVLMSELQKRFKYIPTIPSEEVNPIIEQLLNSKVPEVLQMLKDASLLQQKITEARNIIKRRGNEEANLPTTSVVNNNSNNSYQQISQRERFLKAINKICPRNTTEILELLLTLTPKERSVCLFNEQYLNKRILEANEALEAAKNDVEAPFKPSNSTPASNPPSIEPFVSSHSSHSKSSYSTDVPAVASNGIQTPEYKEIEEFMETLKHKPIHEQKQKLGDRLFPKVKSLGLKSAIASKVTINLLDTDDLRELAHSMNDQEKFRQKFDIFVMQRGLWLTLSYIPLFQKL